MNKQANGNKIKRKINFQVTYNYFITINIIIICK